MSPTRPLTSVPMAYRVADDHAPPRAVDTTPTVEEFMDAVLNRLADTDGPLELVAATVATASQDLPPFTGPGGDDDELRNEVAGVGAMLCNHGMSQMLATMHIARLWGTASPEALARTASTMALELSRWLGFSDSRPLPMSTVAFTEWGAEEIAAAVQAAVSSAAAGALDELIASAGPAAVLTGALCSLLMLNDYAGVDGRRSFWTRFDDDVVRLAVSTDWEGVPDGVDDVPPSPLAWQIGGEPDTNAVFGPMQASVLLDRAGYVIGDHDDPYDVTDLLDRAYLLEATGQELIEANPRITGPHWDPEVYEPGDVPAVVALHTGGLGELASDVSVIDPGTGVVEVQVAVSDMCRRASIICASRRAIPFWVPSESVAAVMNTDPPELSLAADIRLPHDVMFVLLGRAVPFTASGWDAPVGPSPADRRAGDLPAREVIVADGARLVGVTLFADRWSRPTDVVLYHVLVEVDDEPVRETYVGSFHQGALHELVWSLAAFLSWGNTTGPLADPWVDVAARASQVRKCLRKGRFRRAERSGGPFGVRILDLSSTSRVRGDAPLPSDRSVSPHLRKGHWRKSRVGPRSSWHYEGRWIAPTVVAGTAGADLLVPGLYRASRPPKGTSTAPVVPFGPKVGDGRSHGRSLAAVGTVGQVRHG